MNLTRLALRNIAGSAFRSWVVGLCALLVAGFALGTTLIMRGAENSLKLALGRLGADILVVPEGTQMKVESALLMGHPASVWMPQDTLGEVAAIQGVAVASPQLYLSTLSNASCCSVSNMFLVAYDPATDFTVEPWLETKLGKSLKLGEVVGGRYVFTPEGEQKIKAYGYPLTLKANMEATGTGLDETMFMTFDTAEKVAEVSRVDAEQPLVIPAKSISSVLVRVKPGVDPQTVAVEILQQVPGVTPVESLNLFQSYRKQMTGLLQTVTLVMGITWALCVVMIGLVFSMAAYERRRELGVLRSLGATRMFVFRSLLTEAGLLAILGGSLGAGLTALTVFLFRNFIINTIGLPFLFPGPAALAGQIGIGLLAALVSVALAALIPAYKISHQDPAVAMRE